MIAPSSNEAYREMGNIDLDSYCMSCRPSTLGKLTLTALDGEVGWHFSANAAFSTIFTMCRLALTLVGSIISLASFVSARKSDIMVNAARESWISMENMKTLLEVSLNVSKCCNVYISGHSPGTENLFNEFIRIYPYEYVVNSRTFNCDGYFLISESVDSLVTGIKNTPTIISTTELLIIVDDNVEDSAELFNVSMYENANVNIVALNGLWTLTENYLRPRTFKMVFRHKEMVHKRGIVDFEGRKLDAAAFHQPPYCYLQTLVNRTVNGKVIQFFEAKNESELDGIEFKLFLLIAERLNFTWTVRQPTGYGRHGSWNKTHWNGGLIGSMFRKEVDIAFSGVWLMEAAYRFTNMTTPWAILDVRFLVPRPRPYTSFWALTRPLSPQVWLAVLVMLIVQSIYVYASAWISPRITKRFRSFAITWTELMGRLLGTCAPKKMQGLEIQFQLWHFIGLLVVTAYSSSLAASLTNLKYEDRIDTPQEFMRANLTWGRKYKPLYNVLFNENDRYAKGFRQQFEIETSVEDRNMKISRGNYAVIGSAIDSMFFPEDPVRTEDLKHFRVMKKCVSKYYSTFAVQPWLLESANQVMLWLKEGGLVHYHLHDVLHRRTSNALREVKVEHDGYVKDARVLRLTPLAAGFSMLIVGLFVSTVVFYIELHSASRNGSIGAVLLDIKINREARRIVESKKNVDPQLRRR